FGLDHADACVAAVRRLAVRSPRYPWVTRSRSGGNHRRQEARIIWAIIDEEHLSPTQLLRRGAARLPFALQPGNPLKTKQSCGATRKKSAHARDRHHTPFNRLIDDGCCH